MSEAVITFRDVSKKFGDNIILDKANLEVKRGETLAVLGASGSGKSVTLKTINDNPTSNFQFICIALLLFPRLTRSKLQVLSLQSKS